MDTLESLEQPLPNLYNTLFLTVDGDSTDPAHLEAVAATVREEIEKNNLQIFNTALRSIYEHPNLYLARAILAVLVVIGLLVVLLSGF